MKLSRKLIILSVTGLLPFPVLAVSLDAPSAPTNASSAMYSLQSICDRLQSGTTGSQVVFTEPTAGPAGTGCTLNTLMSQAPVLDNINGAMPAEVASGKTFWGLTSGSWGLQTGTVVASSAGANVAGTDSNLVMTIPDGLYSGSKTATANDADLIATNVRSGINIFGVKGDTNVVNTSTGDATAADIATGKKAWVDGVEITGSASGGGSAVVPKTGQTISYAAGDDGDLEKGVTLPSPRFTDNTNGTVTDNLTSLIWLKDANCYGKVSWVIALSNANTLANGLCGLSDGSTAGSWRLPNVKELQSLIDFSKYDTALPTDHPFLGVWTFYYWSSTTQAYQAPNAWIVYFDNGYVTNGDKITTTYAVWPVRGGQ